MRIANKRVFEALVKSGACDSLVPELSSAAEPGERRHGDALLRTAVLAKWRARLFAAIDAACDHGSRQQRNRDLGQFDMFGGGDDDAGATGAVRLPEVAPWSEIEQLNFEKESLGLYWTGHPVDRFAEDLRAYGARTTADLVVRREAAVPMDDGDEGAVATGAALPPVDIPSRLAEEVSIGGIVGGLRPLKTRKGDRMCVFMLEDAAGSVEVVVFPEAFKQFGHLASENGQMVLVKGKFERDDESARILAAEIAPLEMVRERLARSVAIRLSTPPHGRETFEKLWDVLTHHKGDRRVAFDVEVQAPSRRFRVTIDVNAQIRVRPSEELVSDVERICGAGSVSLRQ
jgi:DNA polymerase-3 subunit alpha